MAMTTGRGWSTSSYCPDGPSCVAVRLMPDGSVAVRDTKDRHGPALVFTVPEWEAFLAGARAGEFEPR
jgi:hypothetical protein